MAGNDQRHVKHLPLNVPNMGVIEDWANYLNEEFKSKRDYRVSKPDIWICPEKPKKRMVWPSNWVLDANEIAVMMDKPNDIALYSSIAQTQIDEAEMYFIEHIFPRGKAYPLRTVSETEQRVFYTYFEKAITSVILAYTSLEALANIFIPENYEIRKEENNGIVKIWNKNAIEQTFRLRDKFKIVLRDALKTGDPTREEWWPRFITLEDLRNEIIHSKTSKSELRYTSLLDTSIFDLVRSHRTIIEYYGRFIGSSAGDIKNLFPYGFGLDSVQYRSITEETFDRAWKDITNS